MQRGAFEFLIITLACFFAFFTLQTSISYGRLSEPLGYDDISYLAEALERLKLLTAEGWLYYFENWIWHPIFAPLTVLQAQLAFALFGANYYSPALLNIVWVLFAISIVVWRLRQISRLTILFIILALLTAPLLGYLLIDTRPEMPAGLMLAATLFFMAQPEFGRGGRIDKAAAVFFGLSLIAHPKMLLIGLLGILIIWRFLRREFNEAYNPSLWKRPFALAIAAAVVYNFYLFVINPGTLSLLFSPLAFPKDVSISGWVIYNTPLGVGGRAMANLWAVIPLISAVLSFIYWRAHNNQEGLVLRRIWIIALLLLGVLTIIPSRSIYFSSAWWFYVWFATAQTIALLMQVYSIKPPISRIVMASGALLFTALLAYQLSSNLRDRNQMQNRAAATSYRGALDIFSTRILQDQDWRAGLVLVENKDEKINASVLSAHLSHAADKQNSSVLLPQIVGLEMATPPKEIESLFDRASMIIMAADDTPSSHLTEPAMGFRSFLLTQAEARGWHSVNLDAPNEVVRMRMLVRPNEFAIHGITLGLDYLEKPSLSDGIDHAFRWGLWPETKLAIKGRDGETWRLSFETRSLPGNQKLRIKHNEMVIAEVDVNPENMTQHQIDIPVISGWNEVTIQYDKHWDGGTRKLGSIYKRLQFVPLRD